MDNGSQSAPLTKAPMPSEAKFLRLIERICDAALATERGPEFLAASHTDVLLSHYECSKRPLAKLLLSAVDRRSTDALAGDETTPHLSH